MPIIRQFRARTVVEETWAKVVCNACGKEGEPFGSRKGDKYIPGGFNLIRLSGGYGDGFPGDCETLEAVICSECTKKWADTWKIPPLMTQGGFSSPTYQASHSETGDLWSTFNGICWKGGEEDFPGWSVWDEDPEDEESPPTPEEENLISAWEQVLGQLDNVHQPLDDTIWKHFKGNYYQVLRKVEDCDGESYLLYRPLYGEDRLFLRPLLQWLEQVEREDYSGSRFTLVE